MKKLLLILIAFAIIFTTVACAGTGKSSKDIVIAVVPQQLGNPVFYDAKDGAEAAAEELGIKLEWVAPVKADAPEQVAVIEGLIEKKVSGIAISCNHPDALADVLKRAIDAGIKVSTFDADSPASGRAFYAGTENYEAGKLCGEYMKKLFEHKKEGTIKVAQLTGILGAFDLEARMRGFADAIAGTNIEVVYTGACEDDIDKSVEIVETYTRSNPDIDAWFFVGGWPFFVKPEAMPELAKWKKASPDHKVVTMDSFYPMLQFFDEGLCDVAIGQNFYQMGYLSVMNLYKLIKGEKIEADTNENGLFINTGIEEVTPENYKEIRAGKKAWD
ncbi:MAG TPA: sugar ABC transporter substrate-binding protein [Clostridiaceae bacterium]|nr:sugar ABC transporter substrate-binding protein [Clostridiaceae bacterium]